MKIIINDDHFAYKGMTFEVAKRLSDRVITTDGNMFFLDQFTPSQYPGMQPVEDLERRGKNQKV